jgi:dUTP pyrophosphatase
MNTIISFTATRYGATLPTRATPQSAGFDLTAADTVTVIGGQGNYMIPTGVSVSFAQHGTAAAVYGRIAGRSGLAVREHLTVAAGVIDADYIGEIKVVVYCTKVGHSYTIKKGERFAQLIPTLYMPGGPCANDDATTHAGFGSTGMY